MIKIPTIVAGTVCLFASQYAYAADLPVKARPPVVEAGWAGFYIGGQWGAIMSGDTRQRIGFDNGGPVGPAGPGQGGAVGLASGEIDRGRVFGGVHAGYNWQWANTVLGIEGDINSLGPLGDVLASGRGRLGLSGGRYLIYGTAGVAYLSRTGSTAVFVGGNGGNGGDGATSPPAPIAGNGGAGGNGFGTLVIDGNGVRHAGFVGGAGVQWMLTPQTAIGLEGLYYVFDNRNGDLGIPDNFFTIRGRVSYHLAPANGSINWNGATASWAGLYAGGQIGTLFNTSNDAISNIGLANGQAGGAGLRGVDGGGGGGGAMAFAAGQRSAAVIGGAHGGYNFQFNNVVFGGEADVNLSSEDSHRRDASIRARLGLAHQSFLFYATGGVAFVRNNGVDAVFAGNGGNGGDGGNVIPGPGGAGGAGGRAVAIRADANQVGFVVGAGVQAKITPNVSVGVEGLYYGLKDDTDTLRIVQGLGPGRAFIGDDNNSAVVLRSRLSVHLSP